MAELSGRDLVAREFEERVTDPSDDDQIAAFYRDSTHMGDDLHDWHAHEVRRDWTRTIVELAKANDVTWVLDVGAGYGDDIRALAADMPEQYGIVAVEPNQHLRDMIGGTGIASCVASLDKVWGNQYDMTICIDVLEHVANPRAFVDEIAALIPVGGLLVETTATDDVTTPLHLESNWGWKPDGQLIGLGFALRQKAGRFHVWQREALALPGPTQSMLIAVWRNVEWHTAQRVAELYRMGWNMIGTWNDGLIPRARNRVVAQWWRSTPDDVFLMIDGDMVFNPLDAARIVERCRAGYDIIGAPYVVRDGTHLAGVVGLDQERIEFHADAEPVESVYVATGFMAVHRRVIDRLIRDQPCLDPESSCPFWDLFPVGRKGHTYLSEDYGFCELARAAGFTLWTDPSIRLGHMGAYMYLPEDLWRPARQHQESLVWETKKNPAYARTMTGPFVPNVFESVSGQAGNGAVSVWIPGRDPVAVM